MQTLTDATGGVSHVAYSGGLISQVTDPFGGTVQFSYSGGQLTAITDQAGYTTLLGYGVGGLTSITNPLTVPDPTWEIAYLAGKASTITGPDGHVRRYAPGTNATTLTDELGRSTTFNFSNNGFGGAGQVTGPAGNSVQQTFDSDRNPTRVIDSRSYFTDSTYDTRGNRLTERRYLNPYPDVTKYIDRSWTYDSKDNVLTATDPAGTERWTYNSNNQVLTDTDKLGHTSTNSYGTGGSLLTVTDRNGIVAVTNTYDPTGRLISTADALGNTTRFQWDGRGRRSQVTDPIGSVTSYAYDLLDRVTTTTYPDQTTIQESYGCCMLTQLIDQRGKVTQFVSDKLGRLIQATDPTGAVVQQAYDAVGNLTSLTDPNNHTWQWQYDALNRRIKEIDPLGNQQTWSYDAGDNVTRRVDGNGAATTYAYDAFSQLILTTYPDGTTIAVTYDALGNRLTVDDATGHSAWTYDALNSVLTALTPMAPVATQYRYDNEGNRTQLIDPDGNATVTGYDVAYRATSVQFPLGGQTLTANFQYDPRGLVTQRTLPNGVVSQFGYDALRRTTSIQHRNAAGTLLFGFAYQYDAAGNPIQETSNRWDTGLNSTVPYQIQYGYDARSQLTSEKWFQNNNFSLELDYTYDPAGNRTRLVRTDPTTSDSPVTVVSTYAADNQIATAVRTAPLDPTQTTTYGEDANGNLTQAAGPSGTTTYGYDYENRLARVALPGGASVQFVYNSDGLRVQKVGIGGSATRYVLDSFQAVLEKDSTGTTRVRYVPRRAQIVSGAVGYYLADRLGTVVGLTDAVQNVTDTFRYDSWGNLLQHQGASNPAYQWAGADGYYLHSDIGLELLGVRYYAPTLGRFFTRDPLGNGYDHGVYSYVVNNPVRWIDPSGRLLMNDPPEKDPVKCGIAATAAAGLLTACNVALGCTVAGMPTIIGGLASGATAYVTCCALPEAMNEVITYCQGVDPEKQFPMWGRLKYLINKLPCFWIGIVKGG